MKAVFRCVGIGILLLFILSSAGAKPMNFYVSPQGNDGWSGTLSSPNRGRTDGPFATLERARDAIRYLKRQGKLPEGGVTVWLRGGIYFRQNPFTLTAEDSGTAASPITYSAYRNEKVRIVGGKSVGGWKPVSEEAVLRRLPPEARGKVVYVDLKRQGITDFGQMRRRGFGLSATIPAGWNCSTGQADASCRLPQRGLVEDCLRSRRTAGRSLHLRRHTGEALGRSEGCVGTRLLDVGLGGQL